jgi:hypothetical protein
VKLSPGVSQGSDWTSASLLAMSAADRPSIVSCIRAEQRFTSGVSRVVFHGGVSPVVFHQDQIGTRDVHQYLMIAGLTYLITRLLQLEVD